MLGIKKNETENSFPGFDGTPLFYRTWTPEKPEGVMVLVHGVCEHSGRYQHFGEYFSQRGYRVAAYDHRGHGRSEGERSYVEKFDHFLNDLDLFIIKIREENPTLPLTLIGHSMGGLIVLASLCHRKPEVDFAVTSGPALRMGSSIPVFQAHAARLIGRWFPKMKVPNQFDTAGLSRDPEVGRRYLEDPLVNSQLSMALGRAILEGSEQTVHCGMRVDIPLLMLHGTGDPICAPAGSRDFFQDVRPEGSEIRLYPDLRHEIFNEPEHESIFDDIANWLGPLDGVQQ